MSKTLLMVTLIPAFLLVSSSVVLQILGRSKFSAGKTWLFSTVLVLFVWISVIAMRFLHPAGLVIGHWLPGIQDQLSINIHLNSDTWIFGFLLVSVLVSVIFHEARYLDTGGHVNILTGSMTITAFGLVSLMSGSALTYLLTWVLIDVIEFLLLVGIIKDIAKHKIAVVSLITRALGINILILYMAVQSSDGFQSIVDGKDITSGVLLIIVAILRMGIIPIHIPYSEEPKIRRGMGSILRFIPVLSVFSFLNFVGIHYFTENQLQGLLALFTLGAIFGAVSWYFARNELNGRPYWILTFGCMAIVAYLRNANEALTGLALFCVAGGTGMFLSLPRKKTLNLYLLLLMAGMLSIPYTPTASIPQSLWGNGFGIENLFLMISMGFLIAGVMRRPRQEESEFILKKDWVWLFHNAGLILIALVPWIVSIINFKALTSTQYWWYSVVLLLFVGIVWLLEFFRNQTGSKIFDFYKNVRKGLNPIIIYMDKFFQFNWLIRIIEIAARLFAIMIGYMVRVLEGDGGILWSFLFLVLLASILITAQVR